VRIPNSFVATLHRSSIRFWPPERVRN